MCRFAVNLNPIAQLLEKQWWNGDENEIKRVKEYEFREGEYVGEVKKREKITQKFAYIKKQ